VTLSFVPGDSIAHRLDPRTKLCVQIAFAAAVYATDDPRALAAATVLAGGCLWAADGGGRDLWTYRFALPVLCVAPVVAGLTLGPPWVQPEAAATTARSSYRVGLILTVAAAYVRSTPVRASRAAIQRVVPGRVGALVAIGVALVFRMLPVLRADLLAARDAVHARGGGRLPVRARMRVIGLAGVRRASARSDRLAAALSARCLAWNPTLPRLAFGRLDSLGFALTLGLVVFTAIQMVG